jgi:hypothetical protein
MVNDADKRAAGELILEATAWVPSGMWLEFGVTRSPVT